MWAYFRYRCAYNHGFFTFSGFFTMIRPRPSPHRCARPCGCAFGLRPAAVSGFFDPRAPACRINDLIEPTNRKIPCRLKSNESRLWQKRNPRWAACGPNRVPVCHSTVSENLSMHRPREQRLQATLRAVGLATYAFVQQPRWVWWPL